MKIAQQKTIWLKAAIFVLAWPSGDLIARLLRPTPLQSDRIARREVSESSMQRKTVLPIFLSLSGLIRRLFSS